jgi:hypothetical protein
MPCCRAGWKPVASNPHTPFCGVRGAAAVVHGACPRHALQPCATTSPSGACSPHAFTQVGPVRATHRPGECSQGWQLPPTALRLLCTAPTHGACQPLARQMARPSSPG